VIISDGRVVANEYYLARVKLSGTANWKGTFPEIGFSGRIPEVEDGFCGLVATPTEIPRCDRPPCELFTIPLDGSVPGPEAPPPGSIAAGAAGGYPVESGEPRFGADRWPASSRVTLRVPTFEIGRRGPPDLSVIACSDHWPPPERVANPGCGDPETCNGVDDD